LVRASEVARVNSTYKYIASRGKVKFRMCFASKQVS